MAPIPDAGGRVVGAVQVFSDNSSAVAAQGRIAELQKLALLDPLTELGNRRFVEMHLNARFDALQRYGWPFGVLFIDLDRFKALNDAYGHAVGDRVLQTVARTLAGALRSFDVVGRWGGDEFVAVIVNVTEEQLAAIAGKLRYLVEESTRPLGGGKMRVSLSIGATLARTIDTVESLMLRADAAMYQSKQAARPEAAAERDR